MNEKVCGYCKYCEYDIELFRWLKANGWLCGNNESANYKCAVNPQEQTCDKWRSIK